MIPSGCGVAVKLGRVAERLIALVLKTRGCNRSVGSNPTSSSIALPSKTCYTTHMEPFVLIVVTLGKDLIFIFSRLIKYTFEFVQFIVTGIWHHPFEYGVVAALIVAIALWGKVCMRFLPDDSRETIGKRE